MKVVISVLLLLVLCLTAIMPTVFFGIKAEAAADKNGKDVARAIGDEGIVLLKNENNALPLKKGESVALLGDGQYLRLYSAEDFKTDEDTLKLLNSQTHATLGVQKGYVPWGAGSSRALGEGGYAAKVDPLDAFKEAAANGEIKLYEDISNGFVNALINSHSEATYKEYIPSEEEYKAAGENADTAIVFIRRWDGECVDAKPEDWHLTENEKNMLKNAEKYFKKVVVVLNTPAPIDTSWAKDEAEGISVDAVLFAGYGGMQGGYPIADVILGRVNPSGKLVTTYAKALEDYPTTETFINDKNVQKYTEDIFLGYRYFETFDPEYKKVNYEFGFGLSYTQFEIAVTGFEQQDTNVTVKLTVTNKGNVAGKEVVQIYLGAPQGKLGKAAKVLCAYEKTKLLQPGEACPVTLSFDLKDFASYDDTGKTGKQGAYVLEAGDYTVYAGNSVKNVKEAGKAKLAALTVVEQLSNATVTTLEKRLLADGSFENLNEEEKKEVVERVENKQAEILVEGEDFEYSSPKSSGGAGTENFVGYLYDPETDEWVDYDGCTASNTWRGNELVYKIEVKYDDQYTFSVRASGHGGVQKPAKITFMLSADDKNYTEYFKVNGTDTWKISTYNAFEDLKADGTVSLKTGTYYVKLKTENAPNIDMFTLTSVNTHTQTFNNTVKDTNEEVKEEETEIAQDPANPETYMLFDVLKGKATLEQVAAGMLNEELASFFIANNGSSFGGSDTVLLKYGLVRLTPNDGPSGIGSSGTSFPCETIVACTWNDKLAQAMGLIIGKECYDNDIDVWLAPGLNLHRNPLAGRNSEYYSEDPYISGVMGTAVAKAAQSMGVSVCIKHFVCNEKETNKLVCDSQVSERALREIYLKPFEMAVKNAKVNGVMSAYNLVNGTGASANKGLLTQILREEWGFEGYVSGDWNNNKNHVDEIVAGNTVREPESFCDINVVLNGIEKGKISRRTLENGAVDVMYVMLRSKRFYLKHSENVCNGDHEFDEYGRCKKCYSPDMAKHENIDRLVKTLINGETFENGAIAADTPEKKSFPWVYTIIGILGITAVGIGTPIIIRNKKKSNGNKKAE